MSWSGRQGSNLRLLRPKRSALPTAPRPDWCHAEDLNPAPSAYKAAALPDELAWLGFSYNLAMGAVNDRL